MKTLLLALSILATLPNAWGAVTDRDRLELGLSKNYIQNGGAESGAAGWATYADGASATPVDGTGGAPNSTWTSSTSSPLSGSASFLFTKNSGASRQGEGSCYAFTLDAADKAKPLTVAYDFTTVSGTYVTGDITTYLIDVTNSTVIQPAPYQIPNVTAGVSQKWISSFQTSASGTSYKLCFHVAVTTNSASVLKFDGIRVSSTYQSYGAVATDTSNSLSITPVAFGTLVNSDYRSYRIGDRWYFRGQFKAGTTAASTASLTLPAGIVIDSTKIYTTAVQKVGEWRQVGTAAGPTSQTATTSGPIFYDGSTTGSLFMGYQFGANVWVKANGNALLNTNDSVTLEFDIPVSGWSSNVLVSSDADTREISAIISGDPASATSGNPIIVPTVGWDSHGAYNATTGRYTCPVPGRYKMFGAGQSASSATTLTIYKNAVSTQLAGNLDSNGEATFAGMVNCVAGDIIDIRPGGTVDFTSASLNITRISGPAQIAASEKVRVKYQNTAGTSITSTITTVPYATKIYDSHSAFNGATGVFTAPRSDYYRLYVRGRLQSVNNSTSQVVEMEAIVTSTPESLSAGVQQLDARFGNGAAHVQNFSGGGTWWLNQGDTIAVQVANTNTIGLDTTVGYNVIQIESQGGI